nr:reverse transcriptase domain-containing protein [Tanacetum cinerariifolium]
MATNENSDNQPPPEGGDLPVPDLLTMEELCQPTLNGRGDDANKHLDKFLHVTQSIKVNEVSDDTLRLYLFPHSLTHHATAWFDHFPRNSITTFEQMAKMFLKKYFPPSMVTKLRNEITNFRQRPNESLFEAWEHYKLLIERCPNHNMLPVTQIDTFYNGLTLRHRDTINAAVGETFMKRRPEECYDLMNNMTAHHNDWDTFAQRSKLSSSITSSFDPKIVALKAEIEEINRNLMKVLQINQQVKAVTPSYETYGGPHSYNDFPATVGHTQNVYATGAYNHGANSYQPQGNRNLLSYRLDNYLEPLGFNQNQNRSNPNQNYQNGNQGNNHANIQGNNQGRNQFFQGARTLPSNTITNPKEDLKGITTRSGIAYKGPTIPTTFSPPKVVECETEVTKDTMPPTNNENTKDVQPRVDQVETQIPNSEPVVAPVVESVEAPVSALKPNSKPLIPYPSRLNDQKLREKANDQMEKIFQIFQDLNFNISFVDALILMPKFSSTIKSLLTNKEKLFELARTPLNEHCSVVLLKKLPEKHGGPDTFLIPCDFSGMDECLALADHGTSINLMPLSIGRVLIDVYEGELTLRVGNKAVTFNLDQTSRYSANYDDESINRIDVIDVACEEYSQKFLGFFVSGNPTPSTEPIVSTSSPTLTPFGDSDFLLEETDAFLAIEDEPISPKIDDSYYDSEGYILLLEEFLNGDPSSPPLPLQKLKVVEPKNEKSSIDEPLVVELKDLPPHLEYAFLEDLKDEEKTALIKVLKLHKQALAWQLFDIKGINPEFCTHKILIEDDFKPVVQHQRRVNPKIHEVIKKEVLKLFDAELIYPISDSPWVNPVHYVPKKGGFTVVENEENELILTQLVTGWHVCIDYLKLNDAIRKDHFPLPFMDQML